MHLDTVNLVISIIGVGPPRLGFVDNDGDVGIAVLGGFGQI